VLLDLRSGVFYRLNAAAARIGEGLARGESAPEIARRLARAFRLSPEAALGDVEAVLARLRQPAPAGGSNPLRFEAGAADSLLHWDGQPVLHIDRQARSVTAADGTGGQPADFWAAALLWAAPHLLLLRGQLVLHGSAVQKGDAVVAFCGASGVGKTTLAHRFTDHGWQLLAEDLVVLAPAGPVPGVAVGGEPAIRRWAQAQAPVLAAQGRVEAGGLEGVAEGPRRPLREVLFPQRTARAGPAIIRQTLTKADGLALVLSNSFGELEQPDLWCRLLEGSRKLVLQVPVVQAHVPEGLEFLAQAVADYSRTVNW
jgi:hypothetical protein